MNTRKKLKYLLPWVIVVGFLILPPLLVRNFIDSAPAIRIIFYSLLLLVFTVYGLYLGFKSGDIVAGMPIAKQLNTDKSRRAVALFFRGLALLMSAAGLFLMAYFVPAVFAFEVGHNPVTTDVQTIRSISSPAMPGAFYIYMSILTNDQKQLSFEYPDPILQVGEQYTFITLPGSNFVLAAIPTD
jgi:hypothetical protein